MLHSEVLKQLFPVELSGANQIDLLVDGAAIDRAFQRGNDLLLEMFPDTASELITRWEARYGIVATPAQTLQQRRNIVVSRRRFRGSLRLQFYSDMITALGYTVTIDEKVDADRYKWRVTVHDTPIYEFYLEDSCVEELLLDWEEDVALESIIQDVKPADTQVVFAYV